MMIANLNISVLLYPHYHNLISMGSLLTFTLHVSLIMILRKKRCQSGGGFL